MTVPMKISRMIEILQAMQDKVGDVVLQSACDNCTTAGQDISVLENGSEITIFFSELEND